jgi:Holliday junction resolvase RusA-like endonuclease
MLTLSIPGVPVSGNHRHGLTAQGEIYLTQRAREYSRRIQSTAQAAVVAARWSMPDYVRVDLELFNIRLDRDNAAKTIHDALQGIVFANDSRILDGTISRYKDDGPARVVITIAPVNGNFYGFAKPRPRRSYPMAGRSPIVSGSGVRRSLPPHLRAAIDAAIDATT